MKKILLVWSKWMLASDFSKYFWNNFDIIWMDKDRLDITDLDKAYKKVNLIRPDIILNLAAYTDVENAEKLWNKMNYEVNAIGVYNLAKISKELGVDLITISTDYVFDGTQKKWYNENNVPMPTNQYGMAKYIWEKLAKSENKNVIIIRTSWLYGWGMKFKNFVNTITELAKKKKELKVINDQFWNPTYTKDLSEAIVKIIGSIRKYRGKIFHFSNTTKWNGISWFDFSKEILKLNKINIKLIPSRSDEFPTKAQRPKYSKLLNNSDIKLKKWQDWLSKYIHLIRTWI